MIVTLLAGGWSATRVNLRKLPGTVIAVNDSMIYAPRWDVGISMDRLWTENRWHTVCTAGPRMVWLRAGTTRNCQPNAPDHVIEYECDHKATTLSDEPFRLNGTHSGFVALNLAYQMRPRELYLVGFDMQRGPKGEAHWFAQYPWVRGPYATSVQKLAEWSGQFTNAARQLRRVSCRAVLVTDQRVAVREFDSINPKELECVPA